MSTIFRRIPLVLDTAIAHSLHLEVIAGYKFLMQNYDVGDHVCLFGSSGSHRVPHGRQLTYCNFDFVSRVLPWCIRCPSTRGNVVQGMIFYKYICLIGPDANLVDHTGRPAHKRQHVSSSSCIRTLQVHQ